MNVAESSSQYSALEPKEQYISPESEVHEIPMEAGIMKQTSYHYMPGWDD